MVELKPISTLSAGGGGSGCSDKQTNSSSSSPKLPSPTSLLPTNFPLTTPPLLPHIIYPSAPPPPFQNYPVNDQGFYYPYFPLHPPYFDNFIYYPNNYYPHPHPDYHFYPQPQPQPFPSDFHTLSFSGCYDGGVPEVVEVEATPPDEQKWRRFVGPRNLHRRRSCYNINKAKKQWKPKDQSSSPPPPPPPSPPSPRTALGNCTTLMIKNIPNHISRKSLISILESHCREQNKEQQQTDLCRSEFDFLYLPFDFWYKKNLGYAFVNFTTVEGSLRLYSSWNGKGWDGCVKIREITCARLQGREKSKKHFQISIFNCHSEEYLPVIFTPARDGFNSSGSRMSTVGKRIIRATNGSG